MTTSTFSAASTGPTMVTFDATDVSVVPVGPYTPLAFIGGTPVYPLGGGRSGGGIEFIVGDDDGPDPTFADRDNDDDDDDEDDEDEVPRGRRSARRDDAADDDDGDEDGWTPPSREAVERMETALKRANGEAAKRRNVGKTMKKLGIDDGDLEGWMLSRGLDPETGAPLGGSDADGETGTADTADDDGQADNLDEFGYEREQPTDRKPAKATKPAATTRDAVRLALQAERRGERKALDRLTPIIAQQAAETALRAAGFSGDSDKLAYALRFIDPSAIDVEVDADTFDIQGIDEQVDELKEQFPELFTSRAKPARRETTSNRRTGASRIDGGDRGRQPARARTWEERAAEQMTRRGRR